MKRKRQLLKTAREIVDAGLAPPERTAELERIAARYALAITPALAELIDPLDPRDPIARQVLPHRDELAVHPIEHADPIGDDRHSPLPGIVHRYPDRVLLKVVEVCAVYCRFCFRRETVGRQAPGLLAPGRLQGALSYVRQHPQIWEVILSGGDPLVLSPRRLRALMKALAAIEHVRVIRIHTRLPVAAPDRVNRALIGSLTVARGKAVYVVLHVNHPRELTPAARQACAAMVDSGIPMLSQSVLLRGVNDDAATLSQLMRGLVENRIKPYYLHHGDLAPGTSHLRTEIGEGQELMRQLRGRTSGLCQPTYVLDIPGGHGKVPIGPQYLAAVPAHGSAGALERGPRRGRSRSSRRSAAPIQYVVEDCNGRSHCYPPLAGWSSDPSNQAGEDGAATRTRSLPKLRPAKSPMKA